ncbi:MAG: hypothetical protein WC003_10155 [Terrimicrobiaceae bacterium]
MSESRPPDETEATPAEGTQGMTQKVHVDSLLVRDRLVFQTADGTYVLTVGKNSRCILNSSSPSKKGGQIILRGGTNAEVTEQTPNRIYAGGRLAYTFDEGDSTLVTTPVIESIVYEPGVR